MGINAQQKLKGKVIDKKTKQDISFASLYFPELEIGATADGSGEFVLELSSGTY
tara:strand:- start:694 stop:855 length:162 start_codon:yes stop_codon:yes gene_type:complete